MARGDPTLPDVALKRGSQGYGDPCPTPLPGHACWEAGGHRGPRQTSTHVLHTALSPLSRATRCHLCGGVLRPGFQGKENHSQPQQIWTRLSVEGRLTNTGVSKSPLWGSKPLFCLSRGDVTTPKLLIKTKQSKSKGKWCSGRGQASAGKGKTPCVGLWVYSRDSGSSYRSHQAPWAVGKGVRVGGGVGDHQH